MLASLWFLGNADVAITKWRNKKDWKNNDNIHTTKQKRTTYPSPKLTLTLTSHLGQNVGLGEG